MIATLETDWLEQVQGHAGEEEGEGSVISSAGVFCVKLRRHQGTGGLGH
jgi:hypothetical protein